MRPTCAPESLLSPQGDSSQPTSFSVPTFDAFFSSSLTMRTTSSAGVAAYFLSSFFFPLLLSSTAQSTGKAGERLSITHHFLFGVGGQES